MNLSRTFPLIILMIIPSWVSANPNEDFIENWKEDIHYAHKIIREQHISPFHSISEIKLDSMFETLLDKLPSLSESEIEIQMMKIFRSIGDAHTGYNLMSGPHRHYPFRFKFFGNELRVIDAISNYRELVGSSLIAIDSKSLSEINKTLSPYINYVENEYSYKNALSFQITISKLLFASGVTNSEEVANFTFKKGKQLQQKQIRSIPMSEFGQLSSYFSFSNPILEMQDIGMTGIQYAYIKNHKVSYFRFGSYPEFESVLENCEKLQQMIASTESKYLIIDFRGNMGGDFYTGLAFSSCLLDLDQFNWLKGSYVLVDAGTQSAAMVNSVQFKQILNALIVGTPTGADPNHYMENHRFNLPNSKRGISVSKRYYRFISTDTDALYPDIFVRPSWSNFKRQNDEVLSKTLESIGQN